MPRKHASSRLDRVAAHLHGGGGGAASAHSSNMDGPEPAAGFGKDGALIKFGFPKGSLQDATVELFERAQYTITFKPRDYFPEINDPELSLITFRSQEISSYVKAGVIDVGICGHDWIVENGDEESVIEVCELQYSKATSNPARWVLAVPEDSPVQKAEDMEGMTVATELPKTTVSYFAEKGVKVTSQFSWGTTEVKATAGLVDGIVDITETGSSLRANKLRIVDTVLASTTRMIANKDAWTDMAKRKKIEDLALLLQAAIEGRNKVGLKANIPNNAMQSCLAIMPAETAPTVSSLTDATFSSVEIVCTAIQARSLIPDLHRLGARGIFTYDLDVVVR